MISQEKASLAHKSPLFSIGKKILKALKPNRYTPIEGLTNVWQKSQAGKSSRL